MYLSLKKWYNKYIGLFNTIGGVKASTGNKSLSKRVARWDCFKSHVFQLNGKAIYGDKPNRKPALRLVSGGCEALAAA